MILPRPPPAATHPSGGRRRPSDGASFRPISSITPCCARGDPCRRRGPPCRSATTASAQSPIRLEEAHSARRGRSHPRPRHQVDWRLEGTLPDTSSPAEATLGAIREPRRRPGHPKMAPHLRFPRSGRQDLNLRPLDPQSSALPSCATARGTADCTRSAAADGRPNRVQTTVPRRVKPSLSRFCAQRTVWRTAFAARGAPGASDEPADHLDDPPLR